jgi:hypothetical protein
LRYPTIRASRQNVITFSQPTTIWLLDSQHMMLCITENALHSTCRWSKYFNYNYVHVSRSFKFVSLCLDLLYWNLWIISAVELTITEKSVTLCFIMHECEIYLRFYENNRDYEFLRTAFWEEYTSKRKMEKTV